VTQSSGTSGSVGSESGREALIAGRLRQNTARTASLDRRLPSFAIEHALSGDVGHLHAAHDLRALPIPAPRRRATRPLVVWLRRGLRRGLYPLPEAQSVWNGANARVISFLMRQLAAQARAIESLEQQVSELHDERRRDESHR
jgi:hypothetical protein